MSSSTAWMNEIAFVPITQDLYRALLRRYSRGVHSVVEDVLRDFLERTSDDVCEETAATNGLWFGSVYLPEGTRLRTRYRGAYRYMQVAKDAIEYEGRAFPSVAQAVNFVRGQTSNNAWKVLEIQRPNDPSWVPADTLRRSGGLR